MTREEAIKELKIQFVGEYDRQREAKNIAIKALEQEPKIKVLDNDEVARKLGTVDIYEINAWITLLKDLEYLGMKICEVEE